MGKGKLKSLRTYKIEINKKLRRLRPTGPGQTWREFLFKRTANGGEYSCREQFSNAMGTSFRNKEKPDFYIKISRTNIDSLTRMMRSTHTMEDSLGYPRTKFSIIRKSREAVERSYYTGIRITHPGRFTVVVRVQGSCKWRQSLPMFSLYTGLIRDSYNGGTSDRLMYRILKKYSPDKLFGKDINKNWKRIDGAEGSAHYEDQVSIDFHAKTGVFSS